MARTEPELVGCLDCGALNERATMLLDQARSDIDGLEKELRSKRREIAKLKSERSDKLRNSPRYEEAMEVLRHWQATCMPKAREIDSPDRLENVLARLSGGATVEDLKLCATGYSKRPFVTREGRSAHGSPSEWFADAELIYRTPKNVQTGIALASSAASTGPQHAGSLERLSWRAVQYANRRLIIRALTEKYGEPTPDSTDPTGKWLLSRCPRCDVNPVTSPWTGRDIYGLGLTIAPEGMTYIVRCATCGLDETRLIAAITKETE